MATQLSVYQPRFSLGFFVQLIENAERDYHAFSPFSLQIRRTRRSDLPKDHMCKHFWLLILTS